MAHQWQTDFPLVEAHSVASAILAGTFNRNLIPGAWIVAEYAIGRATATEATDPAVRGFMQEQTQESRGRQVLRQLMEHVEKSQAAEPAARSMLPELPWRTIAAKILAAIAVEIGGTGFVGDRPS